MQVTSDVVGIKFKPYRTEITQRMINNYAAAVFDSNPVYLDDRRKEGLIAPPTLAAAVTWPIIANIYDYADLGFPPEALFRIVHYSERLLIHRHLVPGDRITIEGEVAAVIPEKRGTHVVFKLPAVDRKGEPLFTEYVGGMMRGVECADKGRGAENIPALPRAQKGEPLWEVSIPVRREDCYIYEGCADVPFPIHTSPAFAESVGLPDIIYFGIATLARAISELVNRDLEGEPSKICELSCLFRGMVLPESVVRVQLLQKEEAEPCGRLLFRVLNKDGKEAVSGGQLLFRSAGQL